MEGEGSEYGLLFWSGRHGTSLDIEWSQAPSLLIPKDYVLSPMPIVEKALALNNMKQWCCCIIQLCDCTGEPFKGALFYSLFLNQLPGVTHWACTGEHNNDQIFHVHAMLKTNQRSDSLLRSMRTCFDHMQASSNITRRFGQEPTFECIKIQKCHRPESMLKYIMKGPEWVASNHEGLLQLLYDIDKWNLNEKYKKQNEPPTETSSMNPMVSDLINVIIGGSCKTLDDCLKTDPQTMSKYLHRPGLEQILKNCFAYTKATGGGWHISLFAKYTPDPTPIHAIYLHQGLEPSFMDLLFWQWLNKLDSKKNTLVLYGPSNTGKSAFIAGFKQCVPWGEVVNGNQFQFEGLVDNIFGIWEEPLITPEAAEKCKQIFEGMPCSIPIKFKPPKIIPRMPILVTTNHPLWRFCQTEQNAFENRMYIIPFNYPCKDEPLSFRASEYSCECRHCCTSRGCPPTHGGASPGNVQRTNQPLPTGEHGNTGPSTSVDVGTGSLSGTGEGTSRRYHSRHGSPIPGADSKRSHGPKPTGSSSTTTSGIVGSGDDLGPGNTGDRIRSALTVLNEPVVADIALGSHGHASRSDGNRPTGKHTHKRRHVTTLPDIRQPHSSSDMGLRRSDLQEEEALQIPAKERRLDRQMVSLAIPTRDNWRCYLSFLLSRYG
nr:NS1 [Mute swan feces associated chapparvovirus 3]